MDRIRLGWVLSKMSADYKNIVCWHSEVSSLDWLICVFSHNGKEYDVTQLDLGELNQIEIYLLARKIVRAYKQQVEQQKTG